MTVFDKHKSHHPAGFWIGGFRGHFGFFFRTAFIFVLDNQFPRRAGTVMDFGDGFLPEKTAFGERNMRRFTHVQQKIIFVINPLNRDIVLEAK